MEITFCWIFRSQRTSEKWIVSVFFLVCLGWWIPNLIISPSEKKGFVFCFCLSVAATSLAIQLHQKRIRMVCSKKGAQKCPTESNGTTAMDLGLGKDHDCRYRGLFCAYCFYRSFVTKNDWVTNASSRWSKRTVDVGANGLCTLEQTDCGRWSKRTVDVGENGLWTKNAIVLFEWQTNAIVLFEWQTYYHMRFVIQTIW